MSEPGSASARVYDAVAGAPDGELRVVHRGTHAVYAELPGLGILGVTARPAVALPCAVHLVASALPPVERLRIRGGTLRLDDREVRIGRISDPLVPRLSRPQLTAAPLPEPPRAPDEVDEELAALPEPSTPEAVAGLIGRGSGLTPLGDDVICGWLAVHRAVGVPTPDVHQQVAQLSGRTTALSATLLDCAARGEVIPQFADWLRALSTPAEPAAARTLAGVGHTSGRGLLRGAHDAVRRLTAATPSRLATSSRQGGHAA